MATDNTTQESRETLSVFQSNLPLEAKLERARTELFDLSARNRLLNMPRSGKSARILQVVNERSAEIYRFLVLENKPMVFRPGRLTAESAQGDVALWAGLLRSKGEGDISRSQRHPDLPSRDSPRRSSDLCHDERKTRRPSRTVLRTVGKFLT